MAAPLSTVTFTSSTFNTGSAIQSALKVNDRRANLSSHIVLRPFEAKQQRIVLDAEDVAGEPIDLTTFELQSGEFALFSSGPDRVYDPDYRVDEDEKNRDNIVETGP